MVGRRRGRIGCLLGYQGRKKMDRTFWPSSWDGLVRRKVTGDFSGDQTTGEGKRGEEEKRAHHLAKLLQSNPISMNERIGGNC